MRVLSIIILMFFVSCSSTSSHIKKRMNIKKGDLSVSCEVKGEVLFLLVKNNTSSPIIMDNPCIINTHIKVKSMGKEIDLLMRIKPNLECVNREVKILSQEEKEFTNLYGNYSLTELYHLESSVEYEIEVVYYPTVTHLQKDEGIKSLPYFFIVH